MLISSCLEVGKEEEKVEVAKSVVCNKVEASQHKTHDETSLTRKKSVLNIDKKLIP